VQLVKAAGSNYVFNGAGDRAMVSMRKESNAQGVDSVKVWACSLGCYKPGFVTAGGADVEGTYVWMQFLPFEEASANQELQAYVDAVGPSKVDSFGAQAWQAGLAFEQVVDRIVEDHGPNAVTRAAILDGLRHIGSFDAGGWMGATDLKGVSPCYVLLQVRDGAFARVHPTKPGTFDCDPDNVVTVTLDPAKEAAAIK
jgi:ABC-type branched-subunit amino acid transport system substrate-binding protein